MSQGVIYKVKQGDCISSIAYENGLFWETVWNHADNSQLKQKRKDPNVLCPGDEVFVPDKEEKQESCPCEKKHRFQLKGVPARIRLVLVDRNGQPRSDLPYTLEIDGILFSEMTDSNGKIEYSIPPNAKNGVLRIGADDAETIMLNLGYTDPVSEISGIKERLTNLGFYCGEIDEQMTPKLETALRAFQKKHGLNVTGKLDEITRKKLEDLHGS
jgi:hypothetical protein